MALKGDLQTLPLRDLLGWLAQKEASGTLSLSRGMMARRFQLRGGRVMLSSSTDEEMFALIHAMRTRIITSDEHLLVLVLGPQLQ